MRGSRRLVVAAEVALALLTLATVLGMSRLFAGGGWLGPLAVNAVAAHAAAALLRRRGVPLPAAGAAMALGALVVLTWTSYWSTTALGIPTGDTWSAMQGDLSSAWSLYQDVIAPAPAEPGFVLASGLAVWCIAYVADWAAFRLWVPFEATLPAGTLFLFTALLGAPRGRGWSIALYAGGLLAFLLLHRLAHQESTSHWVAERRDQGHRALLSAGTALGMLAVVAGTVLGPSLPGADSPGVLDPRALRDGDDARLTVSPLVDIRSRLIDQAAIEVFQVRATQDSYWRLTSLDRFDGEIWRSSGSFGAAEGALPESVDADVATEPLQQSFSISALAAIWLPSAYEPRALQTDDVEVRYDEDSATLIVDNDVPSSDGLEYRVTSASPRITPDDLTGTAGEVPSGIRDRYLQLPDDLSQRVRDLAAQVTATATSPYQQALLLQDHLRTFTYDLGVQRGHDGDALEQFLFETQRGYCEQFAGSYAAMARSIGLPARVAVGFTQGESDPSQPGVYRVRGEHAHAWPEVYLAGAGWVPFEPTPGRGMPFAEPYTGVAPSQAASGDPTTATTAAPTTTLAPNPSGSIPDGSFREPDLGLDTGAGSAPTDPDAAESVPVRYLLRPLQKVAPIALGIVAAYLLLVPAALLARRALRRRRAVTPEQRIVLAWTEAVEDAEMLGFRQHASETYDERARLLADSVPEAAGEAAQLARLLEAASYSVDGATDADADAAHEAAATIGTSARTSASRGAKLHRWLDPRRLIEAWRQERRSHQRRITTTARADLEVERELAL